MLAPVDVQSATHIDRDCSWTRNEHGALAGVKSTSYAENVRGLGYAANHDASEAIFLNTAGHVCEGTGTNIFVVFGDKVITPPLTSGPLAGVTRELIMEWSTVEQGDRPSMRPSVRTRSSLPRQCAMSRAWSSGMIRHSAQRIRSPEQLPPPSPSDPKQISIRSGGSVSIGAGAHLSARPESRAEIAMGRRPSTRRAVRAPTVGQQDRCGRGQAQYAGHDPQSRNAE